MNQTSPVLSVYSFWAIVKKNIQAISVYIDINVLNIFSYLGENDAAEI